MIYEFKFGLETGHCVPKSGCHLKLFFSGFSSNEQECYIRADSTEIHDVFDLSRTQIVFLFDCRSDIKEPSPQRESSTQPSKSTNHTVHYTKTTVRRDDEISLALSYLCVSL